MTERTVAVIGGGITGVAAAVELVDSGHDVHLFEAEDVLGGKLAETTIDGITCPTGPDAFLSRRPEVAELARRLGLGDRLVHPVARSARIFRDGRLHRLPPSVLGIPASPELGETGLISAAGCARAAEDLSTPADGTPEDETVGSLVRRRLGDEVLEYLVDPLLGGINAGDSDRLSVVHGVPQIDELRRSDPSLIRAAQKRLAQATPQPGPVFTSVEGGLTRLNDAAAAFLAASPKATVHLGASASLHPESDRWSVATESMQVVVNDVVVTTPAHHTAALLETVDPDLGELMSRITYASVALVLLVLPGGSLSVDPAMSGVLVPRKVGHLTTAASIASNKWPDLAPDGEHVLRVSVGRRDDDRWRALDDDSLLTIVRSEVAEILGADTAAGPAAVIRWIDALPQYEVGHGEWAAAVAAGQRRHSGLHLAGAWQSGLGLPACVSVGQRCAQMIPR